MKKIFFTLLISILSTVTFSQNLDHNLKDLDQKIESLLKDYKAAGLSISIVKNNQIIYSKGFGYRDLEKNLPVTTNTVFSIGSATKSFTGSLLGILESENKISLKDKPSQHIPHFQFYNEKMDNLIAIEDLLSHKSGIGNQGTTLSLFPDKDKLKSTQRLRYLKPMSEIKNSWSYSNMGYTLAGTIVEQVSHDSWDNNIRKIIFEPLKMNNSYTTYEDMIKSNDFSIGYGMYEGKSQKVLLENFYSYSPAGAVKSSIKDMTNWMFTWLNKGKFNDTQVIPKQYIERATSLQNIPEDKYSKNRFLYGEGFGWRLESWYGHYKVFHGGNTSGFSALVVLFPYDDIGITILTNQHNSYLPYMISDYIGKELFNLKPEPEYPVIVGDIYKPANESKPFNTEKKITHSLNDYSGKYAAKGYGEINIVNENNALFAVFPKYKFRLEHLNFDTFYMEATLEIPQIMNPTFTIQFINDTKGKITMLKLYSQEEPIEFLLTDTN